MVPCLYFDSLKLDIFDAMSFVPISHVLRAGTFLHF